RIEPAQHAVQCWRTTFLGNRLEPPAQGGTRARPWKKTPGQSPVIQTGAAHEDWKPAAAMDVGNDRGGVARELSCGVLFGGLYDIDEMMRDAATILEIDLVGADVESSIDRGRIAADDFAVVTGRSFHSEGALAGCGRSEDRDEGLTTVWSLVL